MRSEPISIQEALERGRKLPYALIRSLSGVTLGPTPENVDLSEVIEARFFHETEEVRLFRDETKLQAVCLTSDESDITIDKRCELANKSVFGKSITVKEILGFDGDGQAYIACTRLTGWEGGA